MAGLYPYQIEFLKHMTQYKGRGIVQITGRNAGKSVVQKFQMLPKAPKPKIKWKQLPGNKLQAYVDEIQARGFERGLNESDMDPIQDWSKECNCGVRTSFNTWEFKSDKHITMFLMKWSS